jgi:hypothetical protein
MMSDRRRFPKRANEIQGPARLGEIVVFVDFVIIVALYKAAAEIGRRQNDTRGGRP